MGTWTRRSTGSIGPTLRGRPATAARAVLLDNGDWDGGLADLAHPARDGIQTWLIRADPAAGGFLPEERVSAFENLLGADRVLTLPGAPHAPQRTHPADTTAALLHALG
jgi:hypothetical protein